MKRERDKPIIYIYINNVEFIMKKVIYNLNIHI